MKQIFEVTTTTKYTIEIEAKTPEEGEDILNNMTDLEICNELDGEPTEMEVDCYEWVGERL